MNVFAIEPAYLIIVAIIALVAAGIAVMSMRAKLKTAARNNAAEGYVRPGSLKLRVRQDVFMYETVERHKVESGHK